MSQCSFCDACGDNHTVSCPASATNINILMITIFNKNDKPQYLKHKILNVDYSVAYVLILARVDKKTKIDTLMSKFCTI